MRNTDDFFDGFAGGGELPKANVRQGISITTNFTAISAADKNMARLLTLRPELLIKFRNNSLAVLNDEAKKALLEDMQDVLGITPLRNE